MSDLVRNSAGNLYGTTYGGGTGCNGDGCGTIFKIAPHRIESVLYSFCAKSNCTDGAFPEAGLYEDSDGNLYGTTVAGGSGIGCGGNYGCGTVFKLSPDGTQTVLYSFCSQTGCSDGNYPVAGLIRDETGNFYGTTRNGGNSLCTVGSHVGCGTVFKLSPNGTETVLHTFSGYPDDGAEPAAGLYLDSKGRLYGTTSLGGSSANCNSAGCGTVFKIAANGSESILYSFCSETNCSDGRYPLAGLVMDKQGNLLGTTLYGGGNATNCGGAGDCGTVFKVARDGTETVLHSFGIGQDGIFPYAGLLMGNRGYLYGTTYQGGTPDCGTVFQMTETGSYNVNYEFGLKAYDGCEPEAGLIADHAGNLYGTTAITNDGGPPAAGRDVGWFSS
jgi:uncharacterized repeat protein (TIGR03803 family)